MNNNLVLITSVINTPNKPLNYIKTRSVFNREERFEQTKKTIISIRKCIPNSMILFVDCTDFNDNEKNFLNQNCNYILNLWDNKNLHSNLFGLSKSLAEGTMTIEAIKYINNNNIKFDNLFKISGRYYLNENFNYNYYNNNKIVIKKIENDNTNILTVFYKIPNYYLNNLNEFLNFNINKMIDCIGYEILFGLFIKNIDNIKYIDIIGIEGYVSVSGEYYQG